MYVKGMKVKISDDGHGRYGVSSLNPVSTIGIVLGEDPNDPGWYQVQWANDEVNAYEEGTLDIVEG